MHSINTEGPIQRHGLGWLGIGAALTLLGVSVAMNYRFGFSLGKSWLDGQIYGAASAAADCFKALVPFFLFAAIRNRMWSQACAAAGVWAIVAAYSMTSALGHAALNRNDTSGKRAIEATDYKDLRDDLKRTKDSLSWLPPHRGESTVLADILGKKSQKYWNDTNGCTDTDNKGARLFCQEYHKLNAELGSARDQIKYDAKIAEIEGKLAGKSGAAVMSEADPQAAVIAKIFGIDVEKVQSGLTIFVAILIEIGSGFGLYVATGFLRKGRHTIIDLTPENEQVQSRWGRLAVKLRLRPASAPTLPAIASAVASAPFALAGPAVGAPAAVALPGIAESPPIALVANDAGKPAAGLPEPVPAPRPEPNPFLDNAPIPGSEASLRAINFAFDGRPEGQQRAKDKPKIAAKRFAIVCQAYGQTGAFWADEVQALYRKFCTADHREATSMRDVYSALQGLSETIIQYGKVRINSDSDNKAARYTVVPARYVKPKAAPEKTSLSTAAPKEVGDGKSGPFSVASSVAANDVAKPRLTVVPTRSFMPENKRWEIATARSLKGQMRGFSRKQRGSRMHKMARAA